MLQGYLIGTGALYARHASNHFNLCRLFLWDCKNAVKEILAGGISTTSLDYFSHRDKVIYAVRGALRYFFVGRHQSPRTLWDEERDRAFLAAQPASGRLVAVIDTHDLLQRMREAAVSKHDNQPQD